MAAGPFSLVAESFAGGCFAVACWYSSGVRSREGSLLVTRPAGNPEGSLCPPTNPAGTPEGSHWQVNSKALESSSVPPGALESFTNAVCGVPGARCMRSMQILETAINGPSGSTPFERHSALFSFIHTMRRSSRAALSSRHRQFSAEVIDIVCSLSIDTLGHIIRTYHPTTTF